VNFAAYARHLLDRLRRAVASSGDAALGALLEEVEAYPTVRTLGPAAAPLNDVTLPLRLRHENIELAFISTVSTTACPSHVRDNGDSPSIWPAGAKLV
jgi:hypothetical protein